MVLPLLCSLYYQESDLLPILYAAVCTLSVGLPHLRWPVLRIIANAKGWADLTHLVTSQRNELTKPILRGGLNLEDRSFVSCSSEIKP